MIHNEIMFMVHDGNIVQLLEHPMNKQNLPNFLSSGRFLESEQYRRTRTSFQAFLRTD